MSEMDAVDTAQQKEIDELRIVNVRQDSFMKNLLWTFVLFSIIQFSSMIMFLKSFDNGGLGVCPHKDCPHSLHVK